jgi:activating signal cointegrator complex subunit 3
LICAPTGANQINTALFTILQEIEKPYFHFEGLIVYLIPMKALANEIINVVKNKLSSLKIQIRKYTGDKHLSTIELNRTEILVATPEKWDIATRKSGETSIGSKLVLLILDEINSLQDDRGPALETIVARTFRQVEQSQTLIRIVGLSATLPNYQKAAAFLKANAFFHFEPEYRPVPLSMNLIGTFNSDFCLDERYQLLYVEQNSKVKSKNKVQIELIE